MRKSPIEQCRSAPPASTMSQTPAASQCMPTEIDASEEAQEGREAYREKRRPDFGKFPKRP